jgi:signal transduction histidine kinase
LTPEVGAVKWLTTCWKGFHKQDSVVTAAFVEGTSGLTLDEARMRIARVHVSAGRPLRSVWEEMSSIVMAAMQVDRVGVWANSVAGDAVQCRYLSQRSTSDTFSGTVLRQPDFPLYFAALDDHRAIVANDALTDSRTSELRTTYLEPLGIAALLDAPLYGSGHVVGVVCHEHVGEPRAWTTAECDFAMAVADNVARLWEEHLRLRAEKTLRGFEAHMAEIHRMEAVGRMAAGVAHDFRGVLAAMSGFTELALRAPGLSADVNRYLSQVLKAATRGERLVKEVMEFGRDDMAIQPRVLDVRSAVESLQSMFRVLSSSKIVCKFETDAPVSRVFIDPSQLERALLNLVLNARDAMPEGGELTVRVEDVVVPGNDEHDDANTYVSIAIRDTGLGMDEDTLSKILRPFFTTKGEHGTGLGLAIVDQIVTRAGGFIRFHSQPDQGTTAIIHLPRIASATGR